MNFSLNTKTISAVAISSGFALDNCLFTATDQGLWITKDLGKTWENALASLGDIEPFAVTSVITALDKEMQKIVIAGVSGGVLRSENNGETWNFIQFPSPPPLITTLAVAKNQVLYAGTSQDGIFISKDDGKKWVRWNFGLLDLHIFSLIAPLWNDGIQIVYAGTETGIFYSTNQGISWRECDFPIETGAVLALSASSTPVGDRMLAATETGYVYRSFDRGFTWERCVDEIFTGEINPVVTFGKHCLAVCQSKLYQSGDEGWHWKLWDSAPDLQREILTLAPLQKSASEDKIVAWLTDGSIQVMDCMKV